MSRHPQRETKALNHTEHLPLSRPLTGGHWAALHSLAWLGKSWVSTDRKPPSAFLWRQAAALEQPLVFSGSQALAPLHTTMLLARLVLLLLLQSSLHLRNEHLFLDRGQYAGATVMAHQTKKMPVLVTLLLRCTAVIFNSPSLTK